MEAPGQEEEQQEQKKTNVRKFISVAKKHTDMTQLDAASLREFVEQIGVSDPDATDEHEKRVKIREIEIVYQFIGAFDFEGARERSQAAQDNHKRGSAQHTAAQTLAINVSLRRRTTMGRFYFCPQTESAYKSSRRFPQKKPLEIIRYAEK